MIRRTHAVLAALLLGVASVTPVLAQPEIPSSAPAPSPGNPPPSLGAPAPADTAPMVGAPDRTAAQASVRSQCRADRARVCPDASGGGALACLSAAFDKLTPDCQSAVTALKQARAERNGGG